MVTTSFGFCRFVVGKRRSQGSTMVEFLGSVRKEIPLQVRDRRCPGTKENALVWLLWLHMY